MKTMLSGTRLQDDAGDDFLVINVPWDWLATPVEWDKDYYGERFQIFACLREPSR